MQGTTHRAGGVLATFVVFETLRQKGLLLPDTNAYVQLLIMYPFALWGSVAPDLDHGRQSIPAQDPISVGIHKVLQWTGSKHRSWQTHSIAVTGSILAMMHAFILYMPMIKPEYQMEWIILRLISRGIITGVISHLVLDLLTPQGIHLVPNIKFSVVPSTTFFKTGGTWEMIIRRIIIFFNIILLIHITLISFGINVLEYI